MSRYFKYTFSLQRNIRTSRIVGCIYSYKQKEPKRHSVLLTRQVCHFSVKVPTIKSVPHSDEEKFSDSDDDCESDYILDSIMKIGKPLSSLEWENVKTEACSKKKGVNSYNIDGIVLTYCNKYRRLGIGLSYLEHLSQIGKKPNVATVSNFMRLCYNCQDEGVNEQLILSLYEELCSKCSIFDASTSESVILGLCLTSRWQESIELIDMIKLTCSPGGLEYSAIVRKAFDNNEIVIGTKYLEEMLQFGRLPRTEVYLSWLEYLNRISNRNKEERWKLVEEKILRFFEENDLKPTLKVAEILRNWHKATRSEHHAEFTSLTTRGVCKSCQRFLNPISITKEEFEALQSAFLEKVVIGKDVFSKTSPEEMKNFKNYVKNTAPYDMVIDGLNIVYTVGKKNSPKNFGLTLHQVVEHFYSKSQKVLVLGRKHMESWPKQYMRNVYRKANVFLAQDLSQDDPFLLYAALYSGQRTNFLSKDLMRSHSYLLKDKTLRSTFKRWQLHHQYQLLYITQAGEVHVKPPINFNPIIQKGSDGSWHIPYDAEFSANPPQVFEPPTSWLCLTSRRPRR